MPETVVDIKRFIEKINSELIISNNIPENFISIEENLNSSQTIWLLEPVTEKKSKFVFNYSIKGKTNKKYFCFEITNTLVPYIKIPQDAKIKTLKSNKIHTFINFENWNDNVINFMKDSISYCVNHFEPADKFGCCSKYKECSKAKKCLHDNLFYSKACWYRKNLESGKIFY